MSSIHEGEGPLEAKIIHRIFHEIEERTDTDADKVAAIVELWLGLTQKYKLTFSKKGLNNG